MASIYIYYLHDSSLSQEEYDTLVHSDYGQQIYAITDKKEFAKRFESERNMNHFIKVVKSNFDKDEAREFVNVHAGTRLEEFQYGVYQGIGKNEFSQVKYVDILSTNAEYAEVTNIAEGGLFGVLDFEKLNMPNPFKYKNKYVDALDTLELIRCWKYLEYGLMFSDNFSLKKVNGKEVDEIPDVYDTDYDYPDAVIDEVAVFVTLYGDQFNPEFFEEEKEYHESSKA